MAKKSGNTLIKVVVLLAVVGAVFLALDSWRQKTGVNEATAPDGTAPALSREEAERIGTEIGTRIGTEIGTQIGREVAAEMLAERNIQMAVSEPDAAQHEAVPPEPEPAAEPPAPAPAVVAAVESDTAEEEPAPAQEPAPAPRKPRETRTQGTIPGTPVAQPVDDRNPWWIKSSSGDVDTLTLTYAGNFKSSDGKLTGIALMFSGRFNNETDFSAISVSGAGVPDHWELGASPGLIYLPGVPRGSYTVTVKTGLKSVDGKTFKADISGPVDVQ